MFWANFICFILGGIFGYLIFYAIVEIKFRKLVKELEKENGTVIIKVKDEVEKNKRQRKRKIKKVVY